MNSDRLVVLGGTPTRVVDEGRGEVIVLVHATPFDLDYWSGLAGHVRRDRRVIRYDLPGHGSASTAALPSTDRLARDLVDLLDALEVPTAHIVGHSLGATIAQRCALDHPERVRRLSLLGARAAPSEVFKNLAGALRCDAVVADWSINRWFTATQQAADDEAVRYVRGRIRTISVSAWADGLDRVAATDVLEELPRVAVPVDVVVGEEDYGATPEHSREIALAIPHARLRLVGRAGALLGLQHPEVVARLLE